ncbi:acyltransferase [Rhizobium mongolense]|nr:acyltransferase [Rhizobium mongolense]MBB4231772.1 acetyltransferase-like isoleucine patch superfamily enzyme [Rhizobium mongolense]
MPAQLTELLDYTDADLNSLSVGKEPRFKSSKILFNEKNSSVKIGDKANITQCLITLGRNSELVIGDGCSISGKITVGLNSRITIGRDFSVTGNITLRAVESTFINIGDDCLFGSDIIIRTADGHPVYDASTRERLNTSTSISIGNHVWIADRAVILKGSDIGNASVVGVGSVLTKKIAANCIAVGNPARVVKTGTTWERSPNIRTEEYYFDSDALGREN